MMGAMMKRRYACSWARILTRLLALTLLFVLTADAACAESGIGLLKHLDVDGVDYIGKTDMTTILFMGTDRQDSDRARARFREGGQADFILLVAIDHNEKQIHLLQIDRDCMAEIKTVGVFGNISGKRVEQICLSYGMGDGFEMSCELTADAVSKLLFDTEIDMYASLPLSGIGIINEALGGVTMKIPADYTRYDPALEKGAELTLTNEQAEYIVRGRKEIDDGSNAGRMQRQQVFIKAAPNQFKSKLRENINFADQFLDALDEVMIASFTRGRIINELNRAYQYDILPVETLAGEYTIGEDGFQEFHADEEALFAWVVDIFYTPNN